MPPAALVNPGNSAIATNPAAPAKGISLKLTPPIAHPPHSTLLTSISFITNYTPAAFKKFITEAEWTFSPTRCRKSSLHRAPLTFLAGDSRGRSVGQKMLAYIDELRGQEAVPREHHKAGSTQEEDHPDTFGNKDSA